MGGAGRTLALRTSLFLTPRVKASEPNEDATCLCESQRVAPNRSLQELLDVRLKTEVRDFVAVDEIDARLTGKGGKPLITLSRKQHVTADLVILVEGGNDLLRLISGKSELRKMYGSTEPSRNLQIFFDDSR